MFGRGNNDTKLWRQILQILGPQTDYHRRLDSLLETVSGMIEVPGCYLYLLDESGRSFHLERTWRAAAPEEAASSRSLYGDGPTERGAADMMLTPMLDIPRTPETNAAHFVTTAAGDLYAVPLLLGDEQSDAANPVGLLHFGPVPGRSISRQARRTLETILFPLALAIQQAYQEETLRQRLSVTSTRSDVGQRLRGSALKVDRFVNLLLDLALTSTQTEAGFVAIIDTQMQQLTMRAKKNLPPAFIEQVDITPESGLFDWSLAVDSGALIIRDFDFMERMGMRSILAVPLLDGTQPLGLFALINFKEADTFAEHNLTLLETFVEQIKLVVHNGRLFNTFTNQYLETVKGLARSLDVRRPHTQDHHQRVTEAGITIAQAMNLPTAQVEMIRTAGLIHDVGMAGIIEVEGGFQADLEHPTIGASMIESLPLPSQVAGAVATHHEWFDGWGFPQGLKGEAIPLEGRILAVAEFIIEMTTENPVRPAWSPEKLLEELGRRRGSQFDPHVIAVTQPLIERQALQLGQLSLAHS